MRGILACVALLSCCATAGADDKPALSDIDFFEQTSAGAPASCGFEFTYILTDHVQNLGGMMAVRGSLAHMGFLGRGVVVLLKFLPMDFRSGPTKPPTPFVPADVTISGAKTRKRLPFKPFPCDPNGPRQVCMSLTGNDLVQFEEDMVDGGVSVTFNRTKGSLDYQIVVDSGAINAGEADPSAHMKKAATHAKCLVRLFEYNAPK